MADIKVKPATKRSSSVKKTVKVTKIKSSEKTSAAADDFIDEEDEINPNEAECLLRSALNIKKSCYVQEDEEQENNDNTEKFQAVDQLMMHNLHSKIKNYEKISKNTEEDAQNYVVIGCRFPNGVVISLGKNKILLRGINDMPDHEKEINHKDVGFTKIIRSVWKNFLKTHQNWPPILNGSVFVVKSNDK